MKRVRVVSAEDVYAAYPLKVARPKALKSIAAAVKRGTPMDVLLERTIAFAEARNGDKEYCPHPTTWFNQDRFNDDPETWKPRTKNQKPKYNDDGTF